MNNVRKLFPVFRSLDLQSERHTYVPLLELRLRTVRMAELVCTPRELLEASMVTRRLSKAFHRQTVGLFSDQQLVTTHRRN